MGVGGPDWEDLPQRPGGPNEIPELEEFFNKGSKPAFDSTPKRVYVDTGDETPRLRSRNRLVRSSEPEDEG
jgi:hypothetical protein